MCTRRAFLQPRRCRRRGPGVVPQRRCDARRAAAAAGPGARPPTWRPKSLLGEISRRSRGIVPSQSEQRRLLPQPRVVHEALKRGSRHRTSARVTGAILERPSRPQAPAGDESGGPRGIAITATPARRCRSPARHRSEQETRVVTRTRIRRMSTTGSSGSAATDQTDEDLVSRATEVDERSRRPADRRRSRGDEVLHFCHITT